MEKNVIYTGPGWYWYMKEMNKWLNLGGVYERMPHGLGVKLRWIDKRSCRRRGGHK